MTSEPMPESPIKPPPHPAAFSTQVLDVLEELVDAEAVRLGFEPLILDPFAGIGRVHQLGSRTVGIELEPEWAHYHQDTIPRRTVVGDSTKLADYVPGDAFDMIVTSPCYGNRMADHHDARERCQTCKGTGTLAVQVDGVWTDQPCPPCSGVGARVYKRHTYKHYLGRDLTPNNAGAMQWGNEYRALHEAVWEQCDWALRAGGLVLVNLKNHVRAGQVVDVIDWHRGVFEAMGYHCEAVYDVPTPGLRHGQNHDARVDNEVILCLRKPALPSR